MSWAPPSLNTEHLDLLAPTNTNQVVFNQTAASEEDLPGLPSNWAIVLKGTDKTIGSIGYMRWERTTRLGEIGFILEHRHRNRGYMTEACLAVITFGFEGMLLETVETRSFPHNLASIRVFEKLGMKEEERGKAKLSLKGELVDLVIYRIRKQNYTQRHKSDPS